MRWRITDVTWPDAGEGRTHTRARVEVTPELRALLRGRRAKPDIRHYASADGWEWREVVTGERPPLILQAALRHIHRSRNWRERLQSFIKRPTP